MYNSAPFAVAQYDDVAICSSQIYIFTKCSTELADFNFQSEKWRFYKGEENVGKGIMIIEKINLLSVLCLLVEMSRSSVSRLSKS